MFLDSAVSLQRLRLVNQGLQLQAPSFSYGVIDYTDFLTKCSFLELDCPPNGANSRYQSHSLYNQAPKKAVFYDNQYIYRALFRLCFLTFNSV
jgi:hypothetical protein